MNITDNIIQYIWYLQVLASGKVAATNVGWSLQVMRMGEKKSGSPSLGTKTGPSILPT